MLQTTSAQLLDSIKRNDGGGYEVVRVGAGLETITPSVPTYSVPRGQVLLITQIVTQPEANIFGGLVSFTTSPTGVLNQGFEIRDKANTVQSTASFWSFRRNPAARAPDTPAAVDGRVSAPANIAKWAPKYPLVVPSEWDIHLLDGIDGKADFNSGAAAYGILVDEDSARTLGFDVNTSATDSERRYGVETFTGSGSIAARSGKSIRILDVNVRMQPEGDENGTGAIALIQAAGSRTLHKFANQNHSEEWEAAFSPADCWYLGENSALTVTFTGTNVGSITISYEYVDKDEVPAGVFWGSVAATKPGVDASPVGLTNAQRRANSEITLFYPAIYNLDTSAAASAYTATSPTTGNQHMLYGYLLTAQKDSTAAAEQTLFTLTTGTTGGTVKCGSAFVGTTQDEYQLAPVIHCASQRQAVNCCVDNLMVPCKPDDGSIWACALGFGPSTALGLLSTPAVADHNLDEFQFSVWGRTVAKRYTEPTNQEG